MTGTKYSSWPVTTLDGFVMQHEVQPRAIKMDIEGMELHALQGGLGTLKHHRPALAVDVHRDARTGQPSETRVRALLEAVGYTHLEFEHHTIFAEP